MSSYIDADGFTMPSPFSNTRPDKNQQGFIKIMTAALALRVIRKR